MDSLILFSIILFWLFLLTSFINLYKYKTQHRVLKNHLNEAVYTRLGYQSKKKENAVSKTIKILGRYAEDFSHIGERINFMSESQDVEILLKKAGNPYTVTVSQFQGFKIVFAILGVIISLFYIVLGMPLANISIILFPLFGFGIPIIYIRSQAKKRQQQLRRDLPDFLDTVSISLQAGAGLDGAIKETIFHFEGPLHEEFLRLMHEIELGVPRERAYEDLLVRNDNPDFQSFIKSLIQGIKLGVPVANTFKVQAEEIRKVSIEQVKEKAAKASPKVTLITSLLIAPLVMMMILGLLLLNMLYGESNLLQFF